MEGLTGFTAGLTSGLETGALAALQNVHGLLMS